MAGELWPKADLASSSLAAAMELRSGAEPPLPSEQRRWAFFAEVFEMNLVICMLLTLAVLPPTPEITGTIVDDNGKPVSGVPISVVAVLANQTIEKTLSGWDGSFHFTDIAPGAYGLEAKTDSACAFSDEIGVTIGFTSVVRLRLIKGLCKNPIALFAPPARPHRASKR